MATANPTDTPQQRQSENDNNKESESSEEKEDSEANRAFEVLYLFSYLSHITPDILTDVQC